jgi:site-specific DNA-methyltransferase (adenine-specific)
MNATTLHNGDCLQVLRTLKSGSVDLFYLDPPFFTQRMHVLTTRDAKSRYSFKDIWPSRDLYGNFLLDRMRECHRCLSETGSLFLHCDGGSGPIARVVLDDIFGSANFRSEIIWTYRRWSNSKRGLLPSHQTVLFYSRSEAFKFNTITTSYSESTNVDQILQKRGRDDRNKSIYARDAQGATITNGAKHGVPLGDVWDIPYLNPKARERVGYPTQKPLLLMERIIELCTDKNDLVVDPFCGSGSTLVAALRLGRRAIGIDISEEALQLSAQRLADPVRTDSRLLEIGRQSYLRTDLDTLDCLKGIEHHVVQRNKGIDAILATAWHGKPVCVRVQRAGETVEDAARALSKAGARKGGAKLIVIVVEPSWGLLGKENLPPEITLVQATTAAIEAALAEDADFVAPVSRRFLQAASES